MLRVPTGDNHGTRERAVGFAGGGRDGHFGARWAWAINHRQLGPEPHTINVGVNPSTSWRPHVVPGGQSCGPWQASKFSSPPLHAPRATHSVPPEVVAPMPTQQISPVLQSSGPSQASTYACPRGSPVMHSLGLLTQPTPAQHIVPQFRSPHATLFAAGGRGFTGVGGFVVRRGVVLVVIGAGDAFGAGADPVVCCACGFVRLRTALDAVLSVSQIVVAAVPTTAKIDRAPTVVAFMVEQRRQG